MVRPVDIQGRFWPLDGCETNPLFCFAIWMDTGRTRILPCHMGGYETNPGSRLCVQMDGVRTPNPARVSRWTAHEPRIAPALPNGLRANLGLRLCLQMDSARTRDCAGIPNDCCACCLCVPYRYGCRAEPAAHVAALRRRSCGAMCTVPSPLSGETRRAKPERLRRRCGLGRPDRRAEIAVHERGEMPLSGEACRAKPVRLRRRCGLGGMPRRAEIAVHQRREIRFKYTKKAAFICMLEPMANR